MTPRFAIPYKHFALATIGKPLELKSLLLC